MRRENNGLTGPVKGPQEHPDFAVASGSGPGSVGFCHVPDAKRLT